MSLDKHLIYTLLVPLTIAGCGGGGGGSESNSAPTNSAPVAQNVSANTNEDETVAGQLVGNDSDGDGLSYEIVLTSSVSHKGTLEITDSSTGAFRYVPDPGEYGDDEFTYRVNDGRLSSNNATLTIRINARPDVADLGIATVADEIVADSVSVTDADMGTIALSVKTGPVNGTVVITDATNGDFEYAPNTGFTGQDSFEIVASDGSAESVPATVTVDVSQRPVVNFASATSIGNESQTEAIALELDLSSPLDSTVSILVGGTATDGVDFVHPDLSVVIPAGQLIMDLSLEVLADIDSEVGETVTLDLVEPCYACDVGSTITAHTVTLDDWRGSVNLKAGREIVAEVVADDASAGAIVGGYGTGDFNGTELDGSGFVAKLTPMGTYEWVAEVKPAGAQSAVVYDLVRTPAGLIFATGYVVFPNEAEKILVAQLTGDGVVNWSIAYGGTQTDIADAIAVDSFGDVYVGGRSWSDLAAPNGGSDLVVAKFSSTGQLLWVKQKGSDSDDAGSGAGLAVTTADVVVIGAEMRGAVDGVPIPDTHQGIAWGFTTDGTELWRTTVSDTSPAPFRDIDAHPDGGFVVSGVDSLNELELGKVGGPFIAKFSGDGGREWVYQVNSPDGSPVLDAVVAPSGEIWLSGLTFGDIAGTGNAGGVDIMTLTFDSNGQLLWAIQFGGSSDEWGTGVGLDSMGNAYVTGWSRGELLGFPDPGPIHSVVAKIGPDGVLH